MAFDESELKPECQTCIFWQRKSDVAGECRFRAPLVYSAEVEQLARWPLTHVFDWCGDWAKPRNQDWE